MLLKYLSPDESPSNLPMWWDALAHLEEQYPSLLESLLKSGQLADHLNRKLDLYLLALKPGMTASTLARECRRSDPKCRGPSRGHAFEWVRKYSPSCWRSSMVPAFQRAGSSQIRGGDVCE